MTHESDGIGGRKTLATRSPAFVIRNVSLISPAIFALSIYDLRPVRRLLHHE